MTTSDEMGNFCHDYIQHPLMWCDEKKRLIERKNAEESLRMWRRRKAEEVARKEKDKQEYYDLFLKHCPWGRPGGGAPNIDVRRKDIAAVGLHSTPSVTTAHRITSLQPCQYNDYFSSQKKCTNPLAPYNHHQHSHGPHMFMPPHSHSHLKHTHSVHHLQENGGGGRGPKCKGSTLTICEREVPMKLGAELDAKNGETIASIILKEHASMSFRNKGHVDIEVRYRPTAPGKTKPVLEKIVVKENDKCPIGSGVNNEQKKKLQSRLEKPLCKEPWGKAGPGGKPWRSPKSVGNTFMKSLGWTNKEMLKELDQDNPVTPAERPTFRKKKLQRCCDLCTCTCLAMGGTTSSSPLKPLAKKSNAQILKPSLTKSPPRVEGTKTKSKMCQQMMRNCANDSENTLAPIPNRCEENSTGGGGGVELVPLLARRRGIIRPISLSSTDITKRTSSNDRISKRYLHDLNVQISQKRRSISVSRQVEADQCNQHFITFDNFWGRPGHGAPGGVTNKLKLDNLLYGSQGYSE